MMDIDLERVKEIANKRGRKNKAEREYLELYRKHIAETGQEDTILSAAASAKKSGRKARAGKCVRTMAPTEAQTVDAAAGAKSPAGASGGAQTIAAQLSEPARRENIILFLRCKEEDLYDITPSRQAVPAPAATIADTAGSVSTPQNQTRLTALNGGVQPTGEQEKRLISTKLHDLQKMLHTNTNPDKQSCCFWCTCPFSNPPIYIPKHVVNGMYEVYGCFCMPECAVAFLFNEAIDTNIKWERYTLLNHIYSCIYNYKDNIKPSPSPYYLLDKFYGNMSVEEYRRLVRERELLLVVDKPLTRVMPELLEDGNKNDVRGLYGAHGAGANVADSGGFRLARSKPLAHQRKRAGGIHALLSAGRT
jgi:hypothetical protein